MTCQDFEFSLPIFTLTFVQKILTIITTENLYYLKCFLMSKTFVLYMYIPDPSSYVKTLTVDG